MGWPRSQGRGATACAVPATAEAASPAARRLNTDSGLFDRFVAAQDPLYATVLEEVRQGRKVSHWMWFVFPQIAGLGRSEMSRRYSIESLQEAREYLAHPVLGPRLRECAGIVLATRGRTAVEIFGSIDAMKLRSCMTLFHRAAPDERVFADVLDRYFGGAPDPATDTLLG